MTLCTATKTQLDFDESQQRWLVQLNELDEIQLKARQPDVILTNFYSYRVLTHDRT
jgi:hypothetical protein